MRRCWLLVLALGVLASARAETTRIPRVLHRPPTVGTVGERLAIEVQLPGLEQDGLIANVYYRPAGARSYVSERLEWRGDGRYGGSIPELGTQSISLDYYIEGLDADGKLLFALGSPELPIGVDLLAAERPASTLVLKLAVVLAPLMLLAGVLWSRDRSRRRLVLDQIFWVRTLMPLVHLHGPELTRAVTQLTRRSLRHPVHGERRYRREMVLRKLRQVRDMDLAWLAQQRDRFLGPEWELPGETAREAQPGSSAETRRQPALSGSER